MTPSSLDRNPILQEAPQDDEEDLGVAELVSGRYQIERRLGEGGMAVVYAATDLELDELVALKFLRKRARASEDLVARFLKEARAIAKLKSEHVVRVRAVGTHEGAPYMVMEHLEGTDLADLLAAQRRLSPRRAATLVVQACEGVAEAHARGIVHRDIKPENLFVLQRDDGWVSSKLLDFGISKAALTGIVGDVDLSSSHTTVMMGSPYYMSPEQLRSTRDVDGRADIWSLGAVLFESIAGEPPFPLGLEFTELIAVILESPHRRLRDIAPEVSEELAAIVDRCLEKDPAQRFADAGELAAALLPHAGSEAMLAADRAKAYARSGDSRGARATLPPGRATLPPGRSSLAPVSVPRESIRPRTDSPIAIEARPTATVIRPDAARGSRRAIAIAAVLGAFAIVGGALVVARQTPRAAALQPSRIAERVGAPRPIDAPRLEVRPADTALPRPALVAPSASPTVPVAESIRQPSPSAHRPARTNETEAAPEPRGKRPGDKPEVYDEDERPTVTPMPLDIRTTR